MSLDALQPLESWYHVLFLPFACVPSYVSPMEMTSIVATLALGSRPRPRGCKGAGQEEARSRINPIYLPADNVQHTIGKLSTRATTLL
jgi:hypothetical protein